MDVSRLHLQRYLLTGLVTLLPLWLTYLVFKFVLTVLSGISAPWIGAVAHALATAFPNALGWLDAGWVQGVIALIITIVTIYVVGWAANRMVGQRMLAVVERIITRIPLVTTIYGGTKKLLDLMKTKPDGTQRVVLIDFPTPGMKAVGLVTRLMKDDITGEDYAAVYVPTTPNPTSGYLEVVPLKRITPTDWTMDQAMAFIISGGAIAPDRFRFERDPPTAPQPPPADVAPPMN
jgi:uncharacterized membrane protein